MSVRIYRLLRNNKEEGPLTAEELVSKQLRTYDLIWIDGCSTAWSYPGELPEFKKYAPLSNEEYNRQPVTAISASVQAAIAMNNNIVSSNQKPRYKVSAAWTKIQTTPSPVLPNNNPVKIKEPMVKAGALNQASLVQSKSLSWEEAWLDWEKEKSSNEPVSGSIAGKKINTGRSKKTIANNAPSPKAKYAESSDALKGNYIDDSVQQQSMSKKLSARNNTSEFILPAAALIIIFSIGFWLLHNTNYTEKPVTPIVHQQQPTVRSKNNTAGNNTQMHETVSNLTAKKDDETSENSFNSEEPATDRNQGLSNTKIPVQHKEAVTEENRPTKLFSPTNTKQSDDKSVNKTLSNNNANASTSSNYSSKITDTVTNVSITTPVANTSAPNTVLPANNNIKTTDDYISVPSYIAMNNGNASY